MQTDLTRSKIEIAKSRGTTELEQARMRAEQTVADSDSNQKAERDVTAAI